MKNCSMIFKCVMVLVMVVCGLASVTAAQAAVPVKEQAPKNILTYVQKVQLGDKYGALSLSDLNHDQNTLFVHPGATTPTRFRFDTVGFLHDHTGQHVLTIRGAIAPNTPAEAVRRNAANVKLTILNQGKSTAETVIKVGSPYSLELPLSKKDQLEFVVDNNGDPDTDWFLLSIN